MIFVTVGTTDFDDLVRAMDSLAPKLDPDVVIQYGHGTYEPHNCESFRFARTLEPYYERADVVVSHGGLCTVMEVVKRGLKLVSLSNPDRFDDHQEDILRYMSGMNQLVWCRSLGGLSAAIAEAQQTEFAPYEKPDCRIAEIVTNYLNGLSP
ncbi:MAG: PssE/Cps14G family polysaccharide biosynthesis glycosyltransferase [bacterium]